MSNVIKQYFSYWSESNLLELPQTLFHSHGVIVWAAISSLRIIGFYFIEDIYQILCILRKL